MPQKFIYTRKFIILKTDFTNIDKVKPKGYGRIEIRRNRGNININIENAQKDSSYYIFLIGEDIEKVINLGRIITNQYGRGNFNLYFNPLNVKNTKFPINIFNGIVIRRDKEILLTGNIFKNDDIIEDYLKNLDQLAEEKKQNKRVENEVKIDKEKSIKKEIDVKDKKTVDKEKIKNIVEVKKIRDEVKVTNNIKNKDSIREEIKQKPKQENDIQKEQTSKPLHENKCNTKQNTIKTNYRNQITNYTLNILKFFPKVVPFKNNIQGYDWWEIGYDGVDTYRGFLPYHNYLLNMCNEYPFMPRVITCLDLIKKYNHYLFGMFRNNNEVKYFVYGIPGKFTISEHPFKGSTGFNTWFQSKDKLELGYWLIYIDALTGKVISPLNPMVPFN